MYRDQVHAFGDVNANSGGSCATGAPTGACLYLDVELNELLHHTSGAWMRPMEGARFGAPPAQARYRWYVSTNTALPGRSLSSYH